MIGVFFNATNLFVFLPAWSKVPLTLIGGGMLLLNLVYLFSERQVLFNLMRNKMTWLLLVLFFVWPVVGAIYPTFQGYRVVREVALQLLYTSLVLGVAVLTVRISFARVRTLVFACFFVSVFGIYVQALLPGIFGAIAILPEGSGDVFVFGRSSGFFVNPNVAGRVVILMYLVLALSSKKMGSLYILALSLVAFLAVLLTASRSSLLIALVVFAYVIGHRLVIPYVRGHFSINPVRLLSGSVLLIAFSISVLIVLPLASKYVLEETAVGTTKNLSQRFEIFAYGFAGFTERVEEEALGRWYTIEPYLDGFKESWLFGRGLAGYRIYKIENFLVLTPHNTIFAMWLNYGVFYILLASATVVIFLLSPRTRLMEKELGIVFSPILIIAVLGIMFTFDGLMDQRSFYVFIGPFLALSCVPIRWFDYNRYVAQQSLFTRKHRRTA